MGTGPGSLVWASRPQRLSWAAATSPRCVPWAAPDAAPGGGMHPRPQGTRRQTGPEGCREGPEAARAGPRGRQASARGPRWEAAGGAAALTPLSPTSAPPHVRPPCAPFRSWQRDSGTLPRAHRRQTLSLWSGAYGVRRPGPLPHVAPPPCGPLPHAAPPPVRPRPRPPLRRPPLPTTSQAELPWRPHSEPRTLPHLQM